MKKNINRRLNRQSTSLGYLRNDRHIKNIGNRKLKVKRFPISVEEEKKLSKVR